MSDDIVLAMEILCVEDPMSFKPQEAKVWRRLLGQAKAMVTAHCKTPLKERMRGLCLKRNDCKCEMWTDVYEGYEKLWEALEITADDHMPDLALQMGTFQFLHLVLTLSKQEQSDMVWLGDLYGGEDDPGQGRKSGERSGGGG